MKKKRLLITGSTFPRYEGDTEPRFILDLAKAMKEYATVTVLVPASPEAADREILEGVDVIRYHYFPIHSLETLCYPGAIVPRIKEKKARVLLVPWLFISLYYNLFKMRKEYDIVHSNWLIPQGIAQSFVSTPYIVTGHGGDVTSLNNGIFRRLKRRCLKKAVGVTAVSEPLMSVLEDIYVNKNRAVISMGCDTSFFGKEHYKENLFGQGDKKVILFVGRLAEKKGVTYLIEAMKYINDAILVIAGDGPLKEKLTQQAEKMCKEKQCECIKFIGAKTHEQLRSIYASSDIFVMPSITAKDGDKEGFGLVMLEAMASGLPVVASRSGGIGEVIQNKINGLLCDEKNITQFTENINFILNNSKFQQQLIANELATAARYDYGTQAKFYTETINNIYRR